MHRTSTQNETTVLINRKLVLLVNQPTPVLMVYLQGQGMAIMHRLPLSTHLTMHHVFHRAKSRSAITLPTILPQIPLLMTVRKKKTHVTAAKKRTKNVVEELAGTKKELQAAKKDAREKANAVIELGKEMKSMKGNYNKLQSANITLQSANNALNQKCTTNLQRGLEIEAALRLKLTQAEYGMKLAVTKTALIKSTLVNCKNELKFAVKERQNQKVQTTNMFNNQK